MRIIQDKAPTDIESLAEWLASVEQWGFEADDEQQLAIRHRFYAQNLNNFFPDETTTINNGCSEAVIKGKAWWRKLARAIIKGFDAALNAPARGVSDVKVAARLIDEMLAAQSRFASDWIDSRELTPAQIQDGKLRDEARSKILSMFEGITATIDAPREVTEAMVSRACRAYREAPERPMRAAINAALNAPARVDENAQRLLDIVRFVDEMLPQSSVNASEVLFGIRGLATGKNIDDAASDYEASRNLSEMRDICGGEVGEITRTPEEQAALERAMGDENARRETLVAKIMETSAREPGINDLVKLQRLGQENPNELPMEMLPKDTDSWVLERSDNFHPNGSYEVRIYVGDSRLQIEGIGATPRAAMIAAIEAARERGS